MRRSSLLADLVLEQARRWWDKRGLTLRVVV